MTRRSNPEVSQDFKQGLDDALQDIQKLAHMLNLPVKNPTPLEGRNAQYMLGYMSGIRTFAPAYISKDTYMGKLILLMAQSLSTQRLTESEQEVLENAPVVVEESPAEIDEILDAADSSEDSDDSDDSDDKEDEDINVDEWLDTPVSPQGYREPLYGDTDDKDEVVDPDQDEYVRPVYDDDSDDDSDPDQDEDDDSDPDQDEDEDEDEDVIEVEIPKPPKVTDKRVEIKVDTPVRKKVIPFTGVPKTNIALSENSANLEFTKVMFGVAPDKGGYENEIQQFKFTTAKPVVELDSSDILQKERGWLAGESEILIIRQVPNILKAQGQTFSIDQLITATLSRYKKTGLVSQEDLDIAKQVINDRIKRIVAIILQIVPAPTSKFQTEKLQTVLDADPGLVEPHNIRRADDKTFKLYFAHKEGDPNRSFLASENHSITSAIYAAMQTGGWIVRTNLKGTQAETLNPYCLVKGNVFRIKNRALEVVDYSDFYQAILDGNFPIDSAIAEKLEQDTLLLKSDKASATRGGSATVETASGVVVLKPELAKLMTIARSMRLTDSDVEKKLAQYKQALEDRVAPQILLEVQGRINKRDSSGIVRPETTKPILLAIPVANKKMQEMLLPIFRDSHIPEQTLRNILGELQALALSFLQNKFPTIKLNPVVLIRPYIDNSFNRVENPSKAFERIRRFNGGARRNPEHEANLARTKWQEGIHDGPYRIQRPRS
jgi:hypothetical protein